MYQRGSEATKRTYVCIYIDLLKHLYMKAIPFPLNDTNFTVHYFRTREGPNWFRCYYKQACYGRIDPMEAWRVLGRARNYETGKALKQWCQDMHDQYGESDYVDDHNTDKFFDVPSDQINKMVT